MFWSTGLKSSCLWLGLLLAFTDAVSDDEFGEEARGEAIRIKTFLILTFILSLSRPNKYVLYLYMTLYSMYIPDKSSRRSCKRRLFIMIHNISSINGAVYKSTGR